MLRLPVRSAVPTLLIAAGILIGLPVMNMGSAMAGRVCGPPECYTAECWWIGPGHRRCRRECRRRCYWQPEPRYEEPAYRPPVYAEPAPVYTQPAPDYTPSYASDSSPPDPALVLAVLGGIIALIVGIIGAVTSATEDPTAREIAKIDEATMSANALTDQARATTQALDDFIALKEQDAARRGREAADREWEEFTRHE